MRRVAVLAVSVLILAGTAILYADALEDANEYFLMGQYRQAIDAYQRALSSAPNKAQIYYNLGVCHEKLGNLNSALDNYRRAGSIKDASTKVTQLDRQIKDRKISRLKEEAQEAYDIMNYGVALNKVEQILAIDPQDTWARSLRNRLTDEIIPPPDTATAEVVEESTTTTATIDTAVSEDTAAVEDQTEPKSRGMGTLWLIVGIAALAAFGGGGFLLGILTRKQTVERAMRTLIRLLPAGMLSVKNKNKLSLLFFEYGEIINASVETEDGKKLEGLEAAEALLKTPLPFNDKGKGPWNRFAQLVTEIYSKAGGEEAKETESVKKTKRKSKRRK